MQLFWDRGYHNVSFNELATAVGLTRASLYNSFENKEQLFLEAIRQYVDNATDLKLYALPPGASVGDAFYAVFSEECQIFAGDEKRRGCLFMKCVSDFTEREPELHKAINEIMDDRSARMHKLIARAVEQNELPASTNVSVITNLIWAFIAGFTSFSRSGASEEELREMCFTFLEQVGFAKPTTV